MSEEESLQPFGILYGAPKDHYFRSNSNIPIVGSFWAISDYRKMPKWVVIAIGRPKQDPGTRTEAFKTM